MLSMGLGSRVAGAVLVSGMTAVAGTLFEDVHAVHKPKGVHGYRGMNGDFVQLRDGSILYAYTDGGIVAMRSADQGRTWSAAASLVPDPKPPAQGRLCHPSFLRLANGETLLSYIFALDSARPYYGHNYYRRSADDGATWTDPYIMTPHPGYVLVHNDRLLALSTGRLLAMAEYKAYDPSTRDHNGYVGLAFFSDDAGHSWQASRNTVDMYPTEVQEAHAVELRDGRVMMFARTYSGFPVRAYSSDGGQTWSKGEEMRELAMPYAGLPTVVRIPATGDLLFLWISEKSVDAQDPKVSRRCALSTAISADEGRTFLHQRALARDPQDDFGYQCVEFVGQDLALIGYHTRDGLHVARIGIDWFYEK